MRDSRNLFLDLCVRDWMADANEIKALIGLIDDPDEDIFFQIRDKILSFGADVIPHLEAAWEDQSLGAIFHTRIENIIHKIQFDAVYGRLKTWAENGAKDLLEGAIIVNKYQYADLDESEIKSSIERLRQDIWLELNENLTAFEEVRVFNHILFDVHGFTGNKQNFHAPQNSYLNNVLESKKGNPLSLALLYTIIAQQLNIPIFGVNLPSHFVLAYRDDNAIMEMIGDSANGVMFYINPFSRGTIFNSQEIEQFLKQLELEPDPKYFEPCSNLDIIRRMLSNLIYSYDKLGYPDKVAELKELQKALASWLVYWLKLLIFMSRWVRAIQKGEIQVC